MRRIPDVRACIKPLKIHASHFKVWLDSPILLPKMHADKRLLFKT